MNGDTMNNFKFAGHTLALAILLVISRSAALSQADGKCDVDFRILTDSASYSPGARMHVKFVVTNTGEAPLYFFRNISSCSSQIGSFFLLIIDEKGREANRSGCSSDYRMETVDVLTQLTSPETGMKLKAAEIWGFESTFKLPNKTGVYQLKAELIPAGLTKEQREILSRKNIRVLQTRCAAPVLTIAVK
jgi:hypothetical protein